MDLGHESVDAGPEGDSPLVSANGATQGADLSPRHARSTAADAAAKRKRKIVPAVVLAGVLLSMGFIVFQFLGASSVFFCNVDEMGVKPDCTGSRHVRLQGTVDKGSVVKGSPLKFTVSFGKATAPVVYQGGDPGGVFCEGVPVVVEGVMRSGTFEGDRILVKHTEQYKAGNPDRVRDCGL